MTKTPQKLNKDKVKEIIGLNPDAKQYFFSKADERWLDWFWNNGFLDTIKEKADDFTQYGYRTPEITYLVKVAEKVPSKVVQIMINPDTATIKEKFKPELIDQFLRICATLPADQLALVIPKIHQQEWVKVMGNFNHWGFEYEKIFKTLISAEDYENVLLLAETVLSIHTKDDIAKTSNGLGTDNPFYFGDFDHIGVFNALLSVSDDYAEGALKVVTNTMTQIVLLGGNNDSGNDQVFPIREMFYLFDVDFFTLAPQMSKRLSYRDDVKELAAVIKTLVNRLIGIKCSDSEVVSGLYEKYINTLPDSRAMWRLRLYTLSLCPETFNVKLKTSFFRLFNNKNYRDITSGTEYEKALQAGFGVLSDLDKKDYIEKVIEYFSLHEKGSDEEKWHIIAGSDIFSSIEKYLSEEDKNKIKLAGFIINPTYEPIPSIGKMESGFVQSQGPISQEEFGKMSVCEISEKFKEEWSPEALRDKFKNTDNYLNPHNAEGASDLLKNDISNRLQEYISNAEKFFDRNKLDQHYTYSFLRGIESVVKANRSMAKKIDWDGLMGLFDMIKISGNEFPFEKEKRDSFDGWLAGWTAVHSGMADVLQALLKEENNVGIIDFSRYRDRIFSMISYLLYYSDPTTDREDPEKDSAGRPGQLVSDPFTVAINSTRGRAFQAFTLFIYPDGRELPEGSKIKQDAKELYEKVVTKEDTRALMFMFGHYLPQFYFREIAWFQKIIPQIFPVDQSKSSLFLAAWEGYLSNNLYKELFTDPNIVSLYYRGLSIANIKETDRQYFKDPDEGIASHIALAFIYYDDFGFDSPLFKKFWENNNLTQHKEFIGFIGRSFISDGNSQINELTKKDPEAKELLKTLWIWILENQGETEIFEEFGFWINLEKGIFESTWLAEQVKKTLEKTKGRLDWDYGLTKSSIQLSKDAPLETLIITKLVFLEGGIRVDHPRRQFYVESEWIDVFKNLYANPLTKDGTYQLINDLIREGGSPFWGLKAIIGK